MSRWRTMQLTEGTWRYRFGEGAAVIRFPNDGKSVVVDYAILTGRTPDTIERGQWKKTSDGMVSPGHVRGWIRRHFDPANMPSARGASHRRKPPTASDRPPVGAGSTEEPGSLFDARGRE